MNRVTVLFIAFLFLAAGGCSPTVIYVKATDNVRFNDNTVIVSTVVDMPQDINDIHSANKLAVDEANVKVDAQMIEVIRKIAEEGGASFDEEKVRKYVTIGVNSDSRKDLQKNVWRMEKRIKLNGQLEGVNQLLDVVEIREKPKEQAKGK